MNYCVYLDRGYLVRFLALHASMEQHCLQPYHLWVLALDQETLGALQALNLTNVQVVPFDAVETKALRRVKPQRTRVEYIWTCKATWMLWLLEKQRVEKLMYLDTDMMFFSSPSSVFDEIAGHEIAITPHGFPSHLRHFERNGLFNVGVVYVDQSLNALGCIKRWAEQCVAWCYHRHSHGRFAEQRYLDEWPDMWGAYSIQHKGFNLAPWNQGQHTYVMRRGHLYVDTDPLVLYHFHQGLEPKYRLGLFVETYLYEPYRQALADAERMACQ